MNSAVQNAKPPVVFFDGECGLCSRSVRWLMRRDRKQVLRFAPLQGELAAAKLPELPRDTEEWSLALWDEQGVHFASEASLRSMARVGGFWRVTRLLLVIPLPIRNGIYSFIARNRTRWFGRTESCALFTDADRARLLP